MLGIIFSKDRAMQLDAALKSFFLHCVEPGQISLKVIYAGSSEFFLKQFLVLQYEYPEVDFIPQRDFSQDLLRALGISIKPWRHQVLKFRAAHRITAQYVLFLVDDNIFIRDFCLVDIKDALSQEKDALGFSLQLGTNLSYCYPLNITLQFPNHTPVTENIIKYCWRDAGDGLNYPLEVSSSVYRWEEIARLISDLHFTNPNTLEAEMFARVGDYHNSHPNLLCYKQSVTFCNPVNKVQTTFDNKSGNRLEYSADSLAQLFDEGYRIDLSCYDDFIPNACHQLVEYKFLNKAA